MTSEEVAHIVFEFYMDGTDAEGASEYIIKEAVKRWKDAEQDLIDDVTCVIIFLDTD